jgi:hypothetical protein
VDPVTSRSLRASSGGTKRCGRGRAWEDASGRSPRRPTACCFRASACSSRRASYFRHGHGSRVHQRRARVQDSPLNGLYPPFSPYSCIPWFLFRTSFIRTSTPSGLVSVPLPTLSNLTQNSHTFPPRIFRASPPSPAVFQSYFSSFCQFSISLHFVLFPAQGCEHQPTTFAGLYRGKVKHSRLLHRCCVRISTGIDDESAHLVGEAVKVKVAIARLGESRV